MGFQRMLQVEELKEEFGYFENNPIWRKFSEAQLVPTKPADLRPD